MNTGLQRRDLLIGSAAGMAWLAGCSSESEGTTPTESPGSQQGDSNSPDSEQDDSEESTTESGPFSTKGTDEELITAPVEELRLSRSALPGSGWTTGSESADSVRYERIREQSDQKGSIYYRVDIGAMKRDSVDAAKSLYSDLQSEGVQSRADIDVNIAVQSAAGYREGVGGDGLIISIVAFRDANVVGFVQWRREGANPDDPIETTAELAVEMHQMWRE